MSEAACGRKVFSDTFGLRAPAILRKVENRIAAGLIQPFAGYTVMNKAFREQKYALM
ncbi:hypothetical protein [Cohnella kolymensis]|uniref:hypothetical protein n=1 Tax=Cohnella kolymensis TaxID=1590652 RepID=UPI0013792A96|nr:hypothetical protein [Cohnella kolymensis]